VTPEEAVSVCARNNALWCDAVLKAAGARTEFHKRHWLASGVQVPLFPNIVTLSVDHCADLETGLAALPPNAAVKDSFNRLALGPEGFEKLLTGTWLFRKAQNARRPSSPPAWQKAVTTDALRKWLSAWNGKESVQQVFPVGLLENRKIDFAAVTREGQLQAGAVLNHGPVSDGKEVLGVSNVFCRKSWLYGALHDLLESFPHLPVCTYETDPGRLPVYRQLGFEPVGELTVWRKL